MDRITTRREVVAKLSCDRRMLMAYGCLLYQLFKYHPHIA